MEIAGGLLVLALIIAVLYFCFMAIAWLFGLAITYSYVILGIGVTILVVAILLDSYAIVPSAHYGVKKFLERRITKKNKEGDEEGVVVDEGFQWKLAFFHSFDIFSYKREPIVVDETFMTGKDQDGSRLEIFINGFILYRVNRQEVATTAFEFSEEATKKGIIADATSEFGGVTGTKSAEVFIDNRDTVEVLLASALQLADPPHKKLPAEERFEYCRAHSVELREALRRESETSEKRSAVELRYGIDILSVSIKDVDFTEKTKAALEKQRQDAALAAAARSKLGLVREFKAEGLTPERAVDAAEISLGQGTRQQIGLQGIPAGFINVSLGSKDGN
ncbi:MAG: SPFH domain-containing protein [Patescibacteria group bacterium]